MALSLAGSGKMFAMKSGILYHFLKKKPAAADFLGQVNPRAQID
jgi:ribosomal protein L24E